MVLLRFRPHSFRHDHLSVRKSETRNGRHRRLPGHSSNRNAARQGCSRVCLRQTDSAWRPERSRETLRHVGLLPLVGRFHGYCRRDSGRNCCSARKRRIYLRARYTRLLNGLLVPLLEGLHMLLFLVASMNRFAYRTTNGATDVLATMVMTQHIAAADTVRHQTFLIFAFGNVLPQPLHASTVGSYGTTIIFVLAFCSMP